MSWLPRCGVVLALIAALPASPSRSGEAAWPSSAFGIEMGKPVDETIVTGKNGSRWSVKPPLPHSAFQRYTVIVTDAGRVKQIEGFAWHERPAECHGEAERIAGQYRDKYGLELERSKTDLGAGGHSESWRIERGASSDLLFRDRSWKQGVLVSCHFSKPGSAPKDIPPGSLSLRIYDDSVETFEKIEQRTIGDRKAL